MGLKQGGESPLSALEIAGAVRILARLSDWFDNFGNYTRAHDCRRLIDGITLYEVDMVDPTNAARQARLRKMRAAGYEHVSGYLPPKRAAKVRQWIKEADEAAEARAKAIMEGK